MQADSLKQYIGITGMTNSQSQQHQPNTFNALLKSEDIDI